MFISKSGEQPRNMDRSIQEYAIYTWIYLSIFLENNEQERNILITDPVFQQKTVTFFPIHFSGILLASKTTQIILMI